MLHSGAADLYFSLRHLHGTVLGFSQKCSGEMYKMFQFQFYILYAMGVCDNAFKISYFIPYESSKKVEKSAGLFSKKSTRILAKENPQFYFTSVLASSSQREDRKLYADFSLIRYRPLQPRDVCQWYTRQIQQRLSQIKIQNQLIAQKKTKLEFS